MSRTIVSWDVGIKNLAYCIIKDTNGKFEILKWDLVDLRDTDELKCCETKKIKKEVVKCDAKARFCIEINGEKIGYCGMHKKRYQGLEVDWKDKCFVKGKFDIQCYYEGKKKCVKNSTYKYKDSEYYCSAHYKSVVNRIEREHTIKKYKRKSCMSQTVFSLGERLCSKLDKIKDLLMVDEILIENQPTLKNPTMKTVSTFLFNYFVVRGVVDREKTKSTISNIKFMSPSNKLKVNENQTMEVMNKNKDPEKKYKLTKELAIKYTKILIKDMPDKLKHLESYKKKDDLCDAFLQGYYYMYVK